MKESLRKFFGPILVALGAFLWATDGPVRYPLVQKVNSTTIVFVEHLVGFLYSLPLVAKNFSKLFTFEKKHWFSLLFISLGGSVGATWFFTQSFALTNPTVTILAQKIQPIIAIVMASIILKEAIARRKQFWILALVAMAAVYLVSFGDASFGPPLVDFLSPSTYLVPFTTLPDASFTGLGFALLAAFFWGGSTVFGRLMLDRVSFQLMTALRYFFATVFLLIIVLAFNFLPSVFALTPDQVLSILYIGLVPGLIAMFVYYWGLRSTKASVATLAELTYPVSAATINWVVLGFSLTLTQIFGAAVLIIAILLLSRENAKGNN
jgi:drug/metabolite transporter (DMT)-like permease